MSASCSIIILLY